LARRLCAKATPKDIVAKLSNAFAVAMADPTVRQRIADQAWKLPPPSSRPGRVRGVFEIRDGQVGRDHPRVRHQGAMNASSDHQGAGVKAE